MSDTPREDELPELPTDALSDLPAETQSAPVSKPALAPGEQPPLREMQGAPKHLQTAALIALGGGLLPWQSLGVSGPITWAVGKALILGGIWLLWKSVDLRSGASVPGFVATLGGMVLGNKPDADPKAAARKAARSKGPAKLEVPFPSALHIVGLLVVVIGCLMPMFDSQHHAGFEPKLKTFAELGMLAWAAGTWVHIYAYQRWGQFNPIFPLIFIGMLVAGFATAIQAVTGPNGIDPLALLGGLTVGIEIGRAHV